LRKAFHFFPMKSLARDLSADTCSVNMRFEKMKKQIRQRLRNLRKLWRAVRENVTPMLQEGRRKMSEVILVRWWTMKSK